MDSKIIETLTRIEAKLDNVIKALHDYDEGTLHCEYSGLPSVEAYSDEAYGESSFEAFMDDEKAANKRMDIIGQNGNEGLHYGVEGDNNTQDKHMDKKKNNPKQAPREGYTDATPFIKTKDRRKYYKPKNKGQWQTLANNGQT